MNATEAQARRILRGLGFSTKKIEGRYNKLSGGWRSRCRLATALLVQVDLLMLDEPSNFMVRRHTRASVADADNG